VLTWLRQKRAQRRTARALYGSIVTQSRQHGFYARWGVPDTVEGRFEMLAIHLVMVLRRLATAGQPGRRLQRAVTEVFVVDMDDAMREMTVGDLAVPRHVKRAVALLHDRYAAYGKAFASPQDASLVEAVTARLGPLKGAEAVDGESICAYIRDTARSLERVPDAQVLAGQIEWPRLGGL
jgi:cytochrome b pre-mRNA-processing protein 3